MNLGLYFAGGTYSKELESTNLRQGQYIKMESQRYQVCTYFVWFLIAILLFLFSCINTYFLWIQRKKW